MNVRATMTKAAPYIFFGVGVASIGGIVATAIRATMKLESILDAHTEELSIIKSVDPETVKDEKKRYEIIESQKTDVRKLYFKTVGNIAKLYAPTAALTALSLASFGASFGITSKRLAVSTAALESVSGAFERYRARVREELGEDVDNMYYYDLTSTKVSVEEVDPETGKTKRTKKNILNGVPTGEFCYRFEKYDPTTETGFEQWDESPYHSRTYVLGIIANHQRHLDTGKRVSMIEILKDLRAGDNVITRADHAAGYLPGDKILCGIEEYGSFADSNAYISGTCPDVTLRFNCRRNYLDDAFGKDHITVGTKGDDVLFEFEGKDAEDNTVEEV